MISKAASQKEIMITPNEVENIEPNHQHSDTLSFPESTCASPQELTPRGRSISRKPAHQSNL